MKKYILLVLTVVLSIMMFACNKKVETSNALFGSLHGDISYKKSDRLAFVAEIEDVMANAEKDYLYRKVTFENYNIVDDCVKKYWIEE